MRDIVFLMDNWKFIKGDISPEQAIGIAGESVNLPHTWNEKDGQDGGNDYYRGVCWYIKELDCPDFSDKEEVWIEFSGVAMRAKVYVNGTFVKSHDGGYSTFRVNLTGELREKNIIAVSVDNSENRVVYPQKADFTFYGGIYRDVKLLIVPKAHFALGYCGGCGIRVTPEIVDSDGAAVSEEAMERSSVRNYHADVCVEAWTEGAPDGSVVKLEILDAEGNSVTETAASVQDNHVQEKLHISDVRLWNGKKDPYQYILRAKLQDAGREETEEADQTEVRFGCRNFRVDPEKGFFLNGESYPLCGAARHQDRWGVGNALTKEMHEEDMKLMLEMGANTVRMAHYQHDQYFYDLADSCGMIVWAEIPYISEHMEEARENTISQMTELVVQNYNHPSIICWALSNEITVTGGVTEDLMENHRILNDLCHRLDAARLTATAHAFMLGTEEEFVTLTDIRSYNLYYGWYVGELEENDEWFDRYHEKHPDQVIGLSEYGADANPRYQTANPQKGDYTETYQALYHEHMLEMWKKRPYIWAMHVWNMFDFAADGREEGGKPGQNQKGLVTFDRKIRKDAFYIYKAYLSDEPFVHLCGRRYVDRTETETEIKIYSNQKQVELYVDGEKTGEQQGDKIFVFRIPINGEHRIEARSGSLRDEMIIRHVKEANKEYICPGREVVNWFDREDMQVREGYFSIKDSVAEVKAVPEAAALFGALMEKVVASYGDVAKNVQIPEEMQRKMDTMPIEMSLKQAGKAVTPEMVVELNRGLSRIKKPE